MGPVPTVLCGLQNAPQAGFPEILPLTERIVGLNEIMGRTCFEELQGLVIRRDYYKRRQQGHPCSSPGIGNKDS